MKDLNDYIYSSVPEEAGIVVENENKDKLRELFRNNPNVFYKASELAKMCNFKKSMTDPSVRKCITEFIEEEHLPIIATSKGFKLTTHVKELEDYIDSLNSRVLGIQRRGDAVRMIITKFNNR